MAPSYDKTIATAASLAASLMLVRSLASELLPSEVRGALSTALSSLRARMTWQHTIVIEENEGWSSNRVYSAVKAYLATRINANINMQRLRVSSTDESEKMVVSMEAGEEMADVYQGAEFNWCLVTHEVSGDPNNGGGGAREVRSYEVSFHKRHKEKALKEYLPFIVATAKAIKDQERSLNIYMNERYDEWSPIDLQHPSTFDTLAMDQKQKQSIVDDLDRFIKRKDYYRRIGKAWKRGYLLYGPPGTGKSSLIAAIANHLRFDIYDLELTGVNSNSDLRRLLVGMTNRSILVVEDIDCTIELKQREEDDEEDSKSNSTEKKPEDKVTLSGLLNFVDGLWSTSGEERIIIFTTNYKERLDPALLRPGRMDMHIHMGYCTTEAFRILANNYHSIDYHATYPEIEELIEEVTVTPAEVAEVLMRNDDTDVALHDLVELLKLKKNDATEIGTESKKAEEKKDSNEIKTQSMQVDEKKTVDEIKTESVQVEEKKDDKKVVVKNDFTENGSD
ncbi:AAA-ATPase At3g50940-like [Hordeum vulgare subsp. vulgare]|uniref:AAA+ ATPase domain-containing protein n=1 Tax=Hordeum vulgare subsp. vulgare TaxID=112509 RepID=A0A8I6WVU5_HORVV|nr:AAA-ATPase At3g50940-like [Hordeum vulgare subsp. vulgare]